MFIYNQVNMNNSNLKFTLKIITLFHLFQNLFLYHQFNPFID